MASEPASLPGWHAHRSAVLLDALGGVVISDAERVDLAWLVGFERDTVDHIAAVIDRARRVRSLDRQVGCQPGASTPAHRWTGLLPRHLPIPEL
ncbi:MAG: hypothetical protein ABR608_06325 [Pseudonocardiaceae bacterium]